MKISEYKSYDDLPLFLNSELVAKVPGVSLSNRYELIHQPDFTVLCVATAWWCRKKSTFSGWRSIREVLYEVPSVAETRSRQKLF